MIVGVILGLSVVSMFLLIVYWNPLVSFFARVLVQRRMGSVLEEVERIKATTPTIEDANYDVQDEHGMTMDYACGMKREEIENEGLPLYCITKDGKRTYAR